MGVEARGSAGDVGPEHGDEGMPQQVPHVAVRCASPERNGDFHPQHTLHHAHRPGDK